MGSLRRLTYMFLALKSLLTWHYQIRLRFPLRQYVAHRKRHTLPTELVCHRLASLLCRAGAKGGHIWQTKVDHFSQSGPLLTMVAQRQVGLYYAAENKQPLRSETVALIGEDTTFDLEGFLVERLGSNLRNEVAHGLLDADRFGPGLTSYFWWLVLKLCITTGLLQTLMRMKIS